MRLGIQYSGFTAAAGTIHINLTRNPNKINKGIHSIGAISCKHCDTIMRNDSQLLFFSFQKNYHIVKKITLENKIKVENAFPVNLFVQCLFVR